MEIARKTTVVIDDIIFSLQYTGGISALFSYIIKGLLTDPTIDLWLLERPDARDNIYRREIQFPPDKILRPHRLLPLHVDRYLSVSGLQELLGTSAPFVFHSSYYRYCTDPLARNVTSLHDFTYELMHLRSSAATHIHSWQKHRALKRSCAVACVSEATLNDYRRLLGIPQGQMVQVIYNAASCMAKTDNSSRNERGRIVNLLYVGVRSFHKNFAIIPPALQGGGYRLTIAGPELTAHERRMLDSTLGLTGWVHYSNPDNMLLSRLYIESDALIAPSLHEGFGMTTIEAQANGVPVVSGSSPASREVAGQGALFVEEYTPVALREAITRLNDPEVRNKLIKLGRANAGRFSWKATTAAYASLYRQILG